MPQWLPSQRELDDLDLLVNDSFSPPLKGFVGPDPASDADPISLVVSAQAAEVAIGVGSLDLVDPEGSPLARVAVTGSYDSGDGWVGLAGPVEQLGRGEFGPFRHLHRSPADLHERYDAGTLLAVPVTRPLTLADIAAITDRAHESGRTPLLLACVGEGMPDGVSGPALVRATLQAAALVGLETQVVAVSVADHGWDGPHGEWRSANHWLLASVAAAFADSVVELDDAAQGPRPEAIEAIVTRDRPPRDSQGVVVFFTGLSGSGKSTLARALIDHILEDGERTVTSLDGDVVRHHLSKGLGFSREDRETNIARIGFVAAEISRHGGVAVCSPIAPFESTRAQVRQMVERAGGGFVLVHVATPLEECERRDRKGLYAKARAGQISDFTGISSPYETPAKAIKIDTTNRDIAQCLDELLDALAADGWLHR
ncbi:MAG: adenylyl-sulfate kinase [Nocardioidaceae bacterium]|nr:adenylyl-sulfate kinase [Nocardioidaceae bacterium]